MVTVDSVDLDKPLFIRTSVFWDITLYSVVMSTSVSDERVVYKVEE
jgi:hypothetical protein